MSDAVDVVTRWVAAVNAVDVPAVMALSAGNIEVAGPRASGRGQPTLREWVESGGLTMRTERVFARDGRVVMLQHAEWRDAKRTPIAEATIAHRFMVSDGRVAAVVRYNELAPALRDAQLTSNDELPLS